jgi:hypothetical protein
MALVIGETFVTCDDLHLLAELIIDLCGSHLLLFIQID